MTTRSGAQALKGPGVAVALTAVYVVVFEDIGAITSVVVLVTAWLLIIARKRVVVAAATGLLTGLVVYLVFERLLQGWKAQGYTLTSLRRIRENLRPADLPRHDIGLGEIPGRSGRE